MIKYFRIILLAAIIATVSIGIASPSVLWASKDPFPRYRVIRSNVEFWKNVYSKYTSTQGIVHDIQNLNIIYEVMAIKDPESPGARRINRARVKRAKKKYTRILNGLARGKPPVSKEAKRVAALFGPKTRRRDYRKAVNNIRCQVGQKNRFRKGLIRSGAYMPTIRRIFSQKGLPIDLSYLPHVESSFNPAAYSKFGAAGIWQFTRSTGKRFMTIDYTVDERRDPILSSYAAARLLAENHKKLGNWPLALTAYNHGASGMMRAKRKYGNYPAIFKHYRSRLFRFASRNFYSEFLAARAVAENYKHYFGSLKLHRPADYPEIVLAGYMALDDIVKVMNVDKDEIRRLNPSLRKPVYRGEKYIPKGFRLRLPAKALLAFNSSHPEFPPQMVKARQKRSLFYRVEKGDTAGKIARMHGVRLHDLIMANNLGRRAIIYPGQNLRLPARGEKQRMLASAGKAKRRKEKMETSKPAFPPSTAPEPAAPPAPSNEPKPATAPVVVAKAETSRSKPIVNPTLVVGNLQIERVSLRKGRQIGVIQVAVEETIGHYAEWLQVPASRIRRLNGIRYGQHIHIHQKLKIPLHKMSKASFEEKRFEYHEELVQDFFNAFRVDQIQTYRIRKGDNIWKLCYEVFEVPIWLFQTYNAGLNLTELRMSQAVHIPVVEKIASG